MNIELKNPAELEAVPAQRLADLADSMRPYQAAMVDAVVRLCAIPSIKGLAGPGAPYGAATLQVLEAFLALGTGLGFTAVNLDGRAGYLEWGEEGPLIAMLCHLDVVPAGDGWTRDPFLPLVGSDRIIARGTIDDKGPAVAALYALKALLDDGFAARCRFRLIVGLDEESGCTCMEHYIKVAELPDAGFTPDASFPVIYAEKGIACFDLIVPGGQEPGATVRLVRAQGGARHNMVPAACSIELLSRSATSQDCELELYVLNGEAAHASIPWSGVNAISLAMQEAGQRLAAAGTSHPFVSFFNHAFATPWDGSGLNIRWQDESGPLTINAGVLQLDEVGARLTVDIRYPVTLSLTELTARLEQACAPWGATCKQVVHLAPIYMPRESWLVQSLNGVYQDLTANGSRAIAIGGGTYARTMPNVVAFGPTFPGEPDVCHQVNEYITFRTLLASAAVYREALRKLGRDIAGAAPDQKIMGGS